MNKKRCLPSRVSDQLENIVERSTDLGLENYPLSLAENGIILDLIPDLMAAGHSNFEADHYAGLFDILTQMYRIDEPERSALKQILAYLTEAKSLIVNLPVSKITRTDDEFKKGLVQTGKNWFFWIGDYLGAYKIAVEKLTDETGTIPKGRNLPNECLLGSCQQITIGVKTTISFWDLQNMTPITGYYLISSKVGLKELKEAIEATKCFF